MGNDGGSLPEIKIRPYRDGDIAKVPAGHKKDWDNLRKALEPNPIITAEDLDQFSKDLDTTFGPHEIGKLILQVYEGEKVKIGDDIMLTVLHRKGNNVRLLVEAPKTWRVERIKNPKEPEKNVE